MNQDFECPRCGHCCQALEEKQEPVAWASSLDFDDDDQEIIPAKDKGKLGTSNCDIPLYTVPKQWVGLTDEEIDALSQARSLTDELIDCVEACTTWCGLCGRNKRVDEMVKTEHGKKIEIAQAYQRGWDAAVAQQEPVAWMYVNEDGECEQIEYGPVFDDPGVTPLYTAPPRKQWVGLTDEEVSNVIDDVLEGGGWLDVARALEAAIKRKNT